MKIKINLNGKERVLNTSENERVLDLLKKEGFNSVKDGCNSEGVCGNCAILLDGKLVNSCLLKAPQVDGCSIVTLEGLNKRRELHPIQKAFIDAGLVQCGYCTPSQILAVKELLDKKEHPKKADIIDALSGNICRCTGYEQIFEAVQSLSSKDLIRGDTFRDDLKIVGKNSPKIDAVQLARAETSFTEDKISPNALAIKVKRSPHAHAVIKNIDTSRAENLEGVELIVTHENAPDKLYNTAGQGFPEPSPYDRRLVDKKVRFVGDRVAIVAADDEKTAQKAVDLIKVDYTVMDAVFSMEEAIKVDAPKVHNEEDCFHQFDIGSDLDKNIAASNSGHIGDPANGFREADEIVEEEYTSERVQCTPLEPHIAYTEVINNRLIVHSPTQVPFHIRRILASILEVNESKVRIIKEKIGGGFGSKQDMVLEDVAAWVSWQTGKPAYFRYTRAEEFITRPRYKMKIKVKLGAKKDGTITGIGMDLKAEAGAYGPHCLTVPMNACSKSLPLFRCDNTSYKVTVFYTNNVISGAYQGYGAPPGSFALQLAAAELSKKLKMDHVEFLEKNGVSKGDKLNILKQLGEGQEGIAQVVSSSGIHQALKEGKEMIQWEKNLKNENPDILTGKGVAIIQQGSGLPGIDAGNASLKMLGDGNFMVLFGGTDLGTGLDTVAAKVAAETLKLDLNQVAVTAADTDTTPFDVGSYASSGTYFSGMSVYRASKDMQNLIIKKASQILEVDIDKLKLKYPAKVTGGGKEISFLEIARHTQSGTGSGQLISKGSFTTEEAPIPYAAHFVQVSINKNSGEINVDKYYALHDSGTPINPKLAKGQIYGGVLKTIGNSIYEQLKFDDSGKCINPNFLDYKIPMINELPDDFRAKLVFTDDPLGPYGAKSIGEVVANGAAPAIADAIHDATGKYIRKWPFTPEKILNLLNS